MTQRSIPQLLTINSAYAQIAGHSLEKGIAKETSGNFKKALTVLLTPREEYYANQIHEAVDGAGTKDKVFYSKVITFQKLIRALAYLAENTHLFKAVNGFYIHRYKNNLVHDVGGKLISFLGDFAGDTSGWYSKTSVALIKSKCNI